MIFVIRHRDSIMRTRLWVAVLALLAAAPAAAQPQTQPNASFYLINKAPVAISRVFATPVRMPNWGQDRLASTTIPPGGHSAIRLPADGNCMYDIRVTYANGRNEERRGLNTCDVDNITFPAGRATPARSPRQSEDDPSFMLVNRSRSPVNEVYLSMTGEDDWGDDRLGDATVPAGATKVIRLPPGECLYDLRVVFANGEASEKRRLNLCQINNLRVP